MEKELPLFKKKFNVYFIWVTVCKHFF